MTNVNCIFFWSWSLSEQENFNALIDVKTKMVTIYNKLNFHCFCIAFPQSRRWSSRLRIETNQFFSFSNLRQYACFQFHGRAITRPCHWKKWKLWLSNSGERRKIGIGLRTVELWKVLLKVNCSSNCEWDWVSINLPERVNHKFNEKSIV